MVRGTLTDDSPRLWLSSLVEPIRIPSSFTSQYINRVISVFWRAQSRGVGGTLQVEPFRSGNCYYLIANAPLITCHLGHTNLKADRYHL
jgi:hypothetical protein